jgi:hypothetical protein
MKRRVSSGLIAVLFVVANFAFIAAYACAAADPREGVSRQELEREDREATTCAVIAMGVALATGGSAVVLVHRRASERRRRELGGRELQPPPFDPTAYRYRRR